MTEDARQRIRDSLDSLPDWQVEAMARMARPLDAHIGYGVPTFVLGLPRLSFADGTVSGTLEIGELHLNPHRIAHGMVPFGVLDNALGQIVATSAGRTCVAVEVKVQFLKALRPGKAEVEARLERAGRTIAAASGRITDADGDVCVLATGTYFLLGDR